MITFLKERFREPTPLEVIAAELAKAHLAKLEAESARDYADSVVAYNRTLIARLNTRLKEYNQADGVTQ